MLMEYSKNTSSARSSLKDGLYHKIPRQMKRGWSTRYRLGYDTNNRAVWHEIQNCCIGTTSYDLIREVEENEDGRAACLVLIQKYEGTDLDNKCIILVNQAVLLKPQQGILYKNEHTFLFVKYTAVLQESFAAITKYINQVSQDTMVQ